MALFSQWSPLFQSGGKVTALSGFHASLEVRRLHMRGQREGQDKYDNAA